MTTHKNDSKTHWNEPGTNGLERMRNRLAEDAATVAMGKTLGFRLFSVDQGQAVFVCTPSDGHMNPMGAVHGGLAATLLDSAMGSAIYTTLGSDETHGTIDLNIKFMRPIKPDIGEMRCEGRVTHRGRRVAMADGQFIGPDGKIYASGSATSVITKF